MSARDALAVLAFVVAMLQPSVSVAARDNGAATARWDFDVLLDGKEIGSHRFELTTTDGVRELRTTASFNVKILFINAFSYRHENIERWQDNCLIDIDAETNRNGKKISVTGASGNAGFEVRGKAGTETLGADCVRSFAYWNPAILDEERLLNSESGAYEPVEIAYVGIDTVEAAGRRFAADKYELDTAKGTIKLWYQRETQRWLALEAPAKGGRTIRYQLTNVPALAALPSADGNGGKRNDI